MSLFFCDGSQEYVSLMNFLCALKFLKGLLQEQLTSHKSSKENPTYTFRRVLILKTNQSSMWNVCKTPKYYGLYKSRWRVHKEGKIVGPSGNPLKLIVSNSIKGANQDARKNPWRFISSAQIHYPLEVCEKPYDRGFLRNPLAWFSKKPFRGGF